MEQVRDEKFPKLMAYLRNPVSRRVRTNNHVERTNRMFRLLEKVRYKWRRRKTLVRFVVLTLEGIWRALAPAKVDRANPSVPVITARRKIMQVTITTGRMKQGGDQREVSDLSVDSSFTVLGHGHERLRPRRDDSARPLRVIR